MLYARWNGLRADPVVTEFAAVLDTLEPASGVSPFERVWLVANQYIARDGLADATKMSELIDCAIELVDIPAIDIIDSSARVSEHEPSVDGIARYALQRVRTYNESMRVH